MRRQDAKTPGGAAGSGAAAPPETNDTTALSPQTTVVVRPRRFFVGLAPVAGLIDAVLVLVSFQAACAIRFLEAEFPYFLPQSGIVVGAMLVGLFVQRGYRLERVMSGRVLLARVASAVLLGLGLIIFASYLVPEAAVGRGVFAIHAVLLMPMLLGWRRLLTDRLRRQALRPRTLVAGEVNLAHRVARAMHTARVGGAEVVGILTPGPDSLSGSLSEPGDELFPVLGTYAQLRELVREHRVAQVLVTTHDEAIPLDQALELREDGLWVEDGTAAYEGLTGKLLLERLTPGWLLFANAFEQPPLQRAARRLTEGTLAGLALATLAPFMVLVAVMVRLTSPGPALFRQQRVGYGGRLFTLVKFRTMAMDAESQSGPVWATRQDPRATALGRLLRRTRIDELPQLWNVLAGEMSFVGPRPERPEFVRMLRREVPLYDQRHSVLPGITGWAQINYRYGSSVEDAREKLRYDLYYIQHRNWLLDIHIILFTLKVMLGAENDV